MNSSSSSASSIPETTETVTQREQHLVQSAVFHKYNLIPKGAQTVMMEIDWENHVEYLTNGLRGLPSSFCVLDANRPWLCYWILHSLSLIGEYIDDALENNVVDFFIKCQDPHGGYGGGPGQMPHLATTYAAVNSLITLGGHNALSSIHRDSLYAFLKRMKDPNGAFRMHEKGEIDVRACYTAVAVASILNILDHSLVENVGNFILSCQTYEGGIGGEPGSEAHGGYTFCGLATMVLIGEVHRLDLHALMSWVVFRQGVEGGFQGRTNKLVDGCYSFWQGGVFPLIQRLGQYLDEQFEITEKKDGPIGMPCTHISSNLSELGLQFIKQPVDVGIFFHSFALQKYITHCCQDVHGGFRDKPGKRRDFYHTCYCLSGLSVCQYKGSYKGNTPPLPQEIADDLFYNLLEPTHPLYNVAVERYKEAHDFFAYL